MAMKNTLQGHRKMALVLRRDLGKYLRARRDELKLTLQEISSKVGYDYYNYVYAVEAGKSSISGDKYAAWAKALELEPKAFTRRILQAYDPWAWDILYGSGKGVVNLPHDGKCR